MRRLNAALNRGATVCARCGTETPHSGGTTIAPRCRTVLGLAIAFSALALAVLGCANPGGKPGSGSPIDELNLVAMPMAITVTPQVGSANGIAVKVYAIDHARTKTQPISKGTLDIRMYDGLVGAADLGTSKAAHVWSFSATELPAYSFSTSIGIGYLFNLGWGKDHPRKSQITVIARYLPPQGPPISSAPSFIALSPVPGR